MSRIRSATLVLVLGLVGAGCASGDVPTDDVAVEDVPGSASGTEVADADVARALAWTPPATYVVDLDVLCLCPANRFRVEVADGTVVTRTALDDAGNPTDEPVPTAFAPSLSELLEELRRVHEGVGTVVALETADDGRPTLVALDPLPDAADDELTVRVTRFEAG